VTSVPADDEPQFADLLDDLLTQMLDGDEPDLTATATRHPTVAHRLDEALNLAGGVAGRKHSPRPSLQGYEIVREIGRGGMGTVYLARQTSLDREVALKVLPHSIGLSPRSRPRFLAEARALAKVEHDHIVAIHRIVDEGEVLAFEMEFVDGPSLQMLLDHLRSHREGTGAAPTLAQVAERLGLPLADLGARNLTQFFVRLAAKIASALGAVHAAGLIHRDVKPANILLRRNGQPVLVDFGLVRLTSREISREGSFAGTPVYSAPEQLRGDAAIGPAADVYGLGVTLYECLTLSTPFAGRSTTDQLRRIEEGRIVPLRRAAPGCPRDLETIVLHAMEADVERRYPTAGSLADDLQRLLDLQPIQARPVGPMRRVGKFLRRHRNHLLAGSLGAALVVAAMVPILERVQASSRGKDVARAHLQAARQQIFSIESRRLARHANFQGSTTNAAPPTPIATTAPLLAAVAEYEQALALDPGNRAAERERDVTRLALWLQHLSVSASETLDMALDGDKYRQLCARLGRFTVETARSLALGTRDAHPVLLEEASAGDDDRATAGLLGFLLGDFQVCERAWEEVSPLQRDEPLISAALGMRLLADGLPDIAYAHLQRAQRSFPESAVLGLALAEAALAIGDLQSTRHWLARVGNDDSVALVRERLELDLRAATEVEGDLSDRYHELARRDPDDPTPHHRIAQLAQRRGDLAAAAATLDHLVANWPEVSRFRLDRARVALQQRDLGSYAREVLAVLDLDLGRYSSRGTVADLLEILRIGGLTDLYRQALARTGATSTGRAFLGGEMPIGAFAPSIAANFVFLLRLVHGVQQQVTATCKQQRFMDSQVGQAALVLPLLVARLPLFGPDHLRLRALAAGCAWLVPRLAPGVTLMLQGLSMQVPGGALTSVAIQIVKAPADLPPALAFGHALCRVDDRTGDGIDDVLIGAATRDPYEAQGRVYLVDGVTTAIVDSIEGDCDGQIFGHCLAGIGDIDEDGACDWLIGAPAGTADAPGGLAELWSGRTRRLLCRLEGGPGFGVAVAALGDLDHDGIDDFAVATAALLRNTAPQGQVEIYSGRTRQVLRTLRNDVPGVWFGACMANAGDADGDGRDDLLVGGNYGGRVGDAPGLVRLYSTATGAVLHSWSDPSPDHGFGRTVVGVGDLDGDGRGDVAVSAISDGATSTDQVLVFSGRTGQRLGEIRGTKAGTEFGLAVAPYRRSTGPVLLAVGAPLGGSGSAGAIEFWTASGQPASSLQPQGKVQGFGSLLLPVPDSDGDGRPELFVSNQLDRVWRVASRGMQFRN
jgi:serine/threonine protein kinase